MAASELRVEELRESVYATLRRAQARGNESGRRRSPGRERSPSAHPPEATTPLPGVLSAQRRRCEQLESAIAETRRRIDETRGAIRHRRHELASLEQELELAELGTELTQRRRRDLERRREHRRRQLRDALENRRADVRRVLEAEDLLERVAYQLRVHR